MGRPSCPGDVDFYSRLRTNPSATRWRAALRLRALFFALPFLGLVSPAFGQTTLSPTTLSFGNQAAGISSATKTTTFKNTQSIALSINNISIGGGAAASDYIWGGNCPISPSTLGPGSSCSISVTFKPVALGSAPATLTVTHSAATSPQSVALTGNGINPITLSPTSIAFGNQALGTTSATKTETITNAQTQPITINSIILSGDIAQLGGTCSSLPATLAAGANCTMLIAYSPTTLGSATATITLTDNAAISLQTASLTGTGITPVSLSVNTLDFGSLVMGNTSSTKSVTVTNRENIRLNFAGIATTGDFAVTSNSCGASIAAGATCTVKSTFSPTALGSRTGTLTFTDDAVTGAQVVNLSGMGTPPVSLSSSSLSFANTVVGNTSSSQSVTVTNLKSSYLNFSSITASANFKITSNQCGSSFKPGSTCTVSLTFVPGMLGSIPGSLTFTDNALNGPQIVGLSGIGTSPVALSTSSLSFANSLVGSVSAAQSLTLTNQLSKSLAISSVAVSAQFVVTSNTCGAAVPAGGNCTISVAFAPTAAGITTGTLAIYDGAFGSPRLVGLMGTSSLPAQLTSLVVTPPNPSIPTGAGLQFTATATYSDSSVRDVTSTVTWSSSDTSIATISTAGWMTPLAAGSSTIQATSGAVSGFTTLTVPVTVSVVISPPAATVQAQFGTHDFTATVTNDDLNGGVTWSLSGVGCSGATCGSLSANSSSSGTAITYTPPAAAPTPATVTLTATSVSDKTRSTAAAISIVLGHILVQQSTLPASDTSTQFTYTPTYNSGAAINLLNKGSNDSGNLSPGSYTIVATSQTGWDLTGLTCSSGSGTSTTLTSTNTGTANIDLALGDTITCTYTDTQRGRLVVQEATMPASDNTTAFTLTPSNYQGNTNFTLINGGSNDSGPLAPGSYSVTGLPQTGWVLTNLSCSITTKGTGTSTFDTTNSPTASISLAAGDTTTCIYTNTLATLVTPTGSTLTESFGDSLNLCWTGGPASCDQLWVAQGSRQSIVPTPGTPPPYTAASNSLQMSEVAGSAGYIYSVGTFPRITSGTTFDLFFTVNVASIAMQASHVTRLVTASAVANGSQYAAQVSFQFDGTNLHLSAGGSTSVSSGNISLNSWHTVQLHVASGTTASYMVVDGGGQSNFTANTQDFLYLIVGSVAGNLDAMQYFVGNTYVNSAMGGGPPPSVYVDFEGSLDGTTATGAVLAASTHCGNGKWSVPVPTGLSISSNAEMALHSPITTCGTQYTDPNGTSGLRWDMSQVSDYAKYVWSSPSTSASAGFFFKITSLSEIYNYYSIFDIDGASGLDYATLHIHGGAIYLEAKAGLTNAIPITANTWYWVTIQYNAGGTHHLQVYETTNWTLFGSASNPATGNDLPNQIRVGRTGTETGYPAAFWYYDNIVLDYLNAIFPILP